MSSCNIEDGTFQYNIRFIGNVNIRADGEQAVIDKLGKMLGDNNIILEKTTRVQAIVARKRG